MQVTYDGSVDAGYARLADDPVATTERLSARLLADYDKDGNLLGVELLDASAPLDLPTLRAVPVARYALARIHAMAEESVRGGASHRTDSILSMRTGRRQNLGQRRDLVAAELGSIDDPEVRSELGRRGLVDGPQRPPRATPSRK